MPPRPTAVHVPRPPFLHPSIPRSHPLPPPPATLTRFHARARAANDTHAPPTTGTRRQRPARAADDKHAPPAADKHAPPASDKHAPPAAHVAMVLSVGKYELGETISRDALSIVRLAKNRETGEEHAVKILEKSAIRRRGASAAVKREIAAMTAIHHPHIVRLHEVLSSPTRLYLVMELVRGTDLAEVLAGAGAVIRARDARVLCAQLAAALAYAHTCGVFHGALRARDVLLTARGAPKLSGFGVFAPTPAAALPAAAADAYACGALLERLLPAAAPPGARDLVAMLTHPDPNSRPALAVAARHPWLAAALPPPPGPLALPAPPLPVLRDEGTDPPSPPSPRARATVRRRSLKKSFAAQKKRDIAQRPQSPHPPPYPDHVALMTTMQATVPGLLPETLSPPLSPRPPTSPPPPPQLSPAAAAYVDSARRRSRIPPPSKLSTSSTSTSTSSASPPTSSGARRKTRLKPPPMSPITPPPPPPRAPVASMKVDGGDGLEGAVRAMLPARLHERASQFVDKLERAGVDDEADLRFVLQCKGGVRNTADWLERVAGLSPLVCLRIAAAVQLRAA